METKFIYNKEVKHTGQSMILDHITRNLKNGSDVEFNIDLINLSGELEALSVRMTKSIMEIIMDYNYSNPELCKIMGKANGAPYGGFYESTVNNTTFDLKKFPDSLVIILYKFIELNSKYTK